MRSKATCRSVVVAIVCGLTGCTTYHGEPLPERSNLAASVVMAAAEIEPGAAGHRVVDPAAPLDEDTAAAIAVLNNPDLKAQRLKLGVATAQIFAAGLLPDPQLAVGLSRSSERGGYDFGLSEELQSILTRATRKAAARAQARQVNLSILWQEWQVAEKARELFIQLSAEPRWRELMAANRQVLAQRFERDQSAMRQNAATATTVAADAAALADADTQLRELAVQTNEADHALHALLGLNPDATIHLGRTPVTDPIATQAFQEMVTDMPKRRPDLLALRAGYESQEENVRAAVLSQFPAISVGVDRARSAEEGVATVGLNVSVSLPIFNRNRGRIALERATREQLRAEYQARLDEAANDADRLWKLIHLLEAQYREVEAQTGATRKSAEAADREFKAGNLTLDEYANLRPNLYAREINAVRIRVALAQAEAAFSVVVGAPARRSR